MDLIKEDLKLLEKVSRVESPGEIADFVISLGFNGLFFQRWYPESMDHWEGLVPAEFVDHYYASQIYKTCPIARVIHKWRRNYTFKEARDGFSEEDPKVIEVNELWRRYQMEDGIVFYCGRQDIPAAMIVTAPDPAEAYILRYGPILSYLSHVLDSMLPTDYVEMKKMLRLDPEFSEMQRKIIQQQIDFPEASNAEHSAKLGISPKTLASHQKKIAKKAGVTTFTGAIIQRLRDG